MQSYNSAKKIIVVSGINITHGGPLSIFEDCLRFLVSNYSNEFEIYAFVAYDGLLNVPGIIYKSFPKSKITYFHKLYFEYVVFNKISKDMNVHIWVSFSNLTPRVKCDKLVTYFHNATIVYKPSLQDLLFEPRILAFKLFYNVLTFVNFSQISYLVVQSQWLKNYFAKHIDKSKILVVYPAKQAPVVKEVVIQKSTDFRFIYASFPRAFKNFEVLAKATQLLNAKGIHNFEVCITINGKENIYSRWLHKKFHNTPSLKFIGLLTREEVFSYYKSSDCLVFPSRLETWGLPISEFKYYNKTILASNLEYAYETIGSYKKAKFFDPNSHSELAGHMENLIKGILTYDQTALKEEENALHDWDDLFKQLIEIK